MPPTATFTPEPPTATPVPPTATPTEEPAQERVTRLTLLIRENGNANNGETLFNEFYADVGFACSTCHMIEPDVVGLGPNQWQFYLRAGERVAGFSPEEYTYNSIIAPNDYIVEGFNEGLMPATYGDIFSEQELYDLVAYLLSIGAEE